MRETSSETDESDDSSSDTLISRVCESHRRFENLKSEHMKLWSHRESNMSVFAVNEDYRAADNLTDGSANRLLRSGERMGDCWTALCATLDGRDVDDFVSREILSFDRCAEGLDKISQANGGEEGNAHAGSLCMMMIKRNETLQSFPNFRFFHSSLKFLCAPSIVYLLMECIVWQSRRRQSD